ncbi:MAG: putative SnoaL-like aldol condensation-catalyzing enzyme [Hyphomicrobiaceae bacterium]|jgi:predicted SnoaL-like aldol condensation-catalyzing enzyme
MGTNNVDRIFTLLKGIETGDPAAVNVINPNKYIQHNPQTHEGREGLAALFKRLSKSNPRVNIVRAFEDGDYVFAHTEYDFATRRIGFEVFRFEHGLAVEHWDNIQPRRGPNTSGHSMVDGPTEAAELEQTEENRGLICAFIEKALIQRDLDEVETYINGALFTQHNPDIEDGVVPLLAALEVTSNDRRKIVYDRLHRVLVQGNFALAVSEGSFGGKHSSFYDLFRISEGKIVEHWDTIEAIPPESEWQNDNGKF